MLVYFILLKGQCKHLKHIRHLCKDIFHHVTAMSFKTLGHVMLNVCILEISIPVPWNFFWLELSSGNSNLGTYLYFLQKRTTCILHIMSKCLVWIGMDSSSILNLHNSSINYCKTSFVLNSKTYFINAVFFFCTQVMEVEWTQALVMNLSLLWLEEGEDDTFQFPRLINS